MVDKLYDVIIIGSGAAGLSAAIYAGRYEMKTLVLAGEFGGETARAGVIWNYPGNRGVDGFELMQIMQAQAVEVGAEVVDGEVSEIANSNHCFNVKTGDGKEYVGKTLILANGAKRRHLGLEKEKELTGRGVHYCVTCDGPVYKGKLVAMVGGGDAAVKGVNLMGEYASKIFMIVRADYLRAEPINQEKLEKLGDKVQILYQTEVKEIVGDKKLEKVILTKPYNNSDELVLDGLFIEIGAQPNVELAKHIGVELDERGYVKVDAMMTTNVDGVFAAGDTTSFFGSFKQDITAAAMGAVAATSAYEDAREHGNVCEIHMKAQGVKN